MYAVWFAVLAGMSELHSSPL